MHLPPNSRFDPPALLGARSIRPSSGPPSRSPLLPLAYAIAMSILVGCDSGTAAPPPCEEIPASAYYGDGEYSVGRLVATFYDDTRSTMANGTYPGDPDGRSLPTTVYYPATAEGENTPAASGGPFPVVLYSHGFSSSGGEGLHVYGQLASRGYVVIAPTFPLSNLGAPGGPTGADVIHQPGDLSFLLDTIAARAADAGDPLFGAVDQTRVAAVGLSLGGMTTLLVAYHPTLGDARVRAAVAIAPASAMFGQAYFDGQDAPLTLIAGDSDAIVGYEENAATTFVRAHDATVLVTIRDGTHTGFASYATLFDNRDHADEAGCSALTGGGGSSDDTWANLLEDLGGESVGIVEPEPSETCAIDPLPLAMCPTRQLSLTAELIQAALDAEFAADAADRRAASEFLAASRQRHRELRYESK